VTSEVVSSASSEVDRAYSDHSLAELYDLLNPWGPSDEFYLGLTMSAASVLDVGCGTGALSRSQPGPTAAKPTSITSLVLKLPYGRRGEERNGVISHRRLG